MTASTVAHPLDLQLELLFLLFHFFFLLAGKRFVGKDAVKRGQPSGILQSRLK